MSAPAAPPPAGPAGATPGGPPADNAGGDSGAPKPTYTQNRRLQQTQAQVEEVVDIMRVNVDKVLERDAKISNLDDRADDDHHGSGGGSDHHHHYHHCPQVKKLRSARLHRLEMLKRKLTRFVINSQCNEHARNCTPKFLFNSISYAIFF